MRSETKARSFRHYLTVTEAAEYLGVCAKTLRNWDDAAKLPAIRHPVNGYRLYDPEALEALLGSAVQTQQRPGA
jgi:excisionase family DNA binding protein